MTDEHVLPKKIGGNVRPNNPFLLKNVCMQCNTASGRHIDGPFIRSWFIRNLRSQNAQKFLDLNTNPILPLTFMGELKQTWTNNLICDFWQGPTGDNIYHFHTQYPEREIGEPYTGTPLYLQASDIDPGFAFLFITASNPVWHRCIISSFVEHFKGTVLYLGNGPAPPGGRFSKIPQQLETLHQQINAMSGQKHDVNFAVGTDFGHRFLGKLALGMGAKLLSPDFQQSNDATILRNFMWEKDPNARAKILITGATFFEEKLKNITDLIGWTAGHILLFIPIDGKLLLCPILYGVQTAIIAITTNEEFWKHHIDEEGTIYIVTPRLFHVVGPISVVEYLEVKFNGSKEPKKLYNLFQFVNSIKPLPPFNL